jgi:hypothetical protein
MQELRLPEYYWARVKYDGTSVAGNPQEVKRHPDSPRGRYIVNFGTESTPGVGACSWQATIINLTLSGDEPTAHIIWVRHLELGKVFEVLTQRLTVDPSSGAVFFVPSDSSFDLRIC